MPAVPMRDGAAPSASAEPRPSAGAEPELCCPRCHGALGAVAKGDALRCDRCAHEYPVLHGIPDLRTCGDPYLSIEEDRAAAAELAARSGALTFAELLRSYYEHNARVPTAQAGQFVRGVLAAHARAEATLAAWTTADDDAADPRPMLLDIGCGTAPLLAACGERFPRAIGVDVGLRWLVLARKRLEEAGLERRLVCACAEALPFRAASIDRVAGESVLENVAEPARALREWHRVLRPGGRLWLTAPNKFSLAPDPHLGLWAGGYLPDRVVHAIAMRRGNVPPRRHLVGSGALARAMHEAGFAGARLSLPVIAGAQRSMLSPTAARLVDVYHLLARTPGARRVLLAIGPTIVATAFRPATPAGRE